MATTSAKTELEKTKSTDQVAINLNQAAYENLVNPNDQMALNPSKSVYD